PVREISQCKLLASQVGVEVADDAIQILGGHGYMREFPVERAWRDARLARIGAGTDEIMKEIIAKSYGLLSRPSSSLDASPRRPRWTAASWPSVRVRERRRGVARRWCGSAARHGRA